MGYLYSEHEYKSCSAPRHFGPLLASMIAEIEKPDHSYEVREMGQPICGEDFCDSCGDCLYCYNDYCYDSVQVGCRWVIYLTDNKNPYKELQ